MGRMAFFIIASHLSVNGWWYCATMHESLGETPLVMIPVVFTVVSISMVAIYMAENWDR